MKVLLLNIKYEVTIKLRILSISQNRTLCILILAVYLQTSHISFGETQVI